MNISTNKKTGTTTIVISSKLKEKFYSILIAFALGLIIGWIF